MIDHSQVQTWRSVQNLVPLPYRRVSVQRYNGPMTADAMGRVRTGEQVGGPLWCSGALRSCQLYSPPSSIDSAGGGGGPTRAAKVVWAGTPGFELRESAADTPGTGAYRSTRPGR